ncbi:hypothetical protein LJC59_06530, partial [Desulfovibrio sp. OttesenSCG-928-A18]|nr:hypothetical protein [Desulfovibrio sp. OttesenSCG-928-A18]
MRFSAILLAALLVLALPLTARAAAAELRVNEGKLFLTRDGKSTALAEGGLLIGEVQGASLRYAGIAEEDAAKAGVAAGLYLFDDRGKVAGFLPVAEADMVADVLISPGGKTLITDNGSSVLRGLQFFSYPELNALSEQYFSCISTESPDLFLWLGDDRIVCTDVNPELTRKCPSENCQPLSVVLHNPSGAGSTVLFEGTMLCDFELLSVTDNKLTARKTCVGRPADWEEFIPD